MENGETIFLIALGGFLLGRALWQSVAHKRHLAWISALAGPFALLGLLIDQVWPFVVGIGLFLIGEFLYQTNDPGPRTFADLPEDDYATGRLRRRRTRTSDEAAGRHAKDPRNGGGPS